MSDKRKLIGWAITVLYVCFLAWLACTQWSDIRGLKPNEMGDMLAGAFSPLAFVWLVLGYFQQSDELRQNTKALTMQADQLKLQVQELNASVEQQRQLAHATNAMHISAERPMLTVDAAINGSITDDEGSYVFPFKVTLNNLGRTHALQVHAFWTVVVMFEPEDLGRAWDALRKYPGGEIASQVGGIQIAPGERAVEEIASSLDVPTSQRAREAAERGIGLLPPVYLVGSVSYRSHLGSEHSTPFAREILFKGAGNEAHNLPKMHGSLPWGAIELVNNVRMQVPTT